jgi:5-methylcytosine-specific restriction endonuclease McrA
MRHGGEHRGNSYQRRSSKLRLLKIFGNGETCKCVHCGESLTFATLERDRIIPGGSYAIDNLQPSCSPCNKKRSNKVEWLSPLAIAAQAA